MPSIPDPNPRRRRPLLCLLPILALLSIGLVVVYWQREQTLTAPPGMTAEELTAATDPLLVSRIGHDLSWRLVAPREDRTAWRRFNEAARHVFLVTRLDEPLRQGYLATICATAKQDAESPQPGEIAAAFSAIGAERIAKACSGMAAIQAPDPNVGPPGPAPASDPYAAVGRVLRVALAAEDTVKLCATYIRAHAAQVLAP